MDDREEASRRLVPRRTRRRTDAGGATQPLAKRRGAGQAVDRTSERRNVPNGHEQAVAVVIGQEWQVPGLPADDREARRHRLSPDGSVRLLEAGQHEGVDGLVHPMHRRGVDDAVHHDSITEVGVLDPIVHASCIPAARGRVADEVEGDDVVRQARDGVEEFDDPLPWQPVRDADSGHEATSPEAGSIDATDVFLAGRTAGRDVQILAGRDDSESIARQTRGHELGREPVAGYHEDLARAVRVQVEGGLEPALDLGRIDPAWRLMQHADNGRADKAKPGRGSARSDAVEHEHVCAPSRTREQPGGSGHRRPGQRQVGDRDEPQLGAVIRRAVREAPVEQVAARDAARFADR